MTRLPRALLEVMLPTPRKVGDVLESGVTVRAEVDTTNGAPFDRATATHHLQLLHAPAGDDGIASWTLVAMSSGFTRSTLVATRTFTEFYAMVRENADIFATTSSGGLHWAPAAQMVREFLVDQYAEDDPDEVAEQMLVALGAEPQFLPRSLVD